MKLMRLGPAGAERPVVRIDDATYVDVSDAGKTVTFDQVFNLLRVGMAVNVVPPVRGKGGDTEYCLL